MNGAIFSFRRSPSAGAGTGTGSAYPAKSLPNASLVPSRAVVRAAWTTNSVKARFCAMLSSFFDYLRKPFVELSGTPVSALSVLTALLVVFVAHLISRVLARSLTKAFHHHA